jgi:hypothetical protein
MQSEQLSHGGSQGGSHGSLWHTPSQQLLPSGQQPSPQQNSPSGQHVPPQHTPGRTQQFSPQHTPPGDPPSQQHLQHGIRAPSPGRTRW